MRSTFSNALALACMLSAFVSLTLAPNAILAQIPDLSQSGGVLIHNAGGIRGDIKNSGPGKYEIRPTLGGSVVLDSDLIKQTNPLKKEQIQYRNDAPLRKDTVEERLKIANWAKREQMSALAAEQYQHVLELDPENEEAHKALQHVKENGVWVSKKEQMEQKGLVLVGGRNVSTQEAELYQAKKSEDKQRAAWRKQIGSALRAAKEDDQRAKEQLRSIKDPLAHAAVSEAYKNERNPEARVLLVQALASIGNPAALGQLGVIALKDPDDDVRTAAIDGICRKRLAKNEAIGFFREQLTSSNDVAEINRAAYALEKLKAEQAIPDLINSLVTAHKRNVAVGSEQTGMTVDSTGNISGFSPGGGTKVKTVTDLSQNETVRQALVAIVAAHYQEPVDYGFDKLAWIRWLQSSEQLGNFNPRRDR